MTLSAAIVPSRWKMLGRRFGRLTVIGYDAKYRLCHCDCGGQARVHLFNLKRTRSCGCLRSGIEIVTPVPPPPFSKPAPPQMTERECLTCNTVKALSEFHVGKNSQSGRRAKCKLCCNKERIEDRELHQARKSRYYAANRDALVSKSKDWYHKNIEENRLAQRLARYGLSRDEYDAMAARQAGRCALCKRPFGEAHGNREAIDHDHKTGRVRGLLHNRCNTAIGMIGEDPDVLRAAIAYLQSHSESK